MQLGLVAILALVAAAVSLVVGIGVLALGLGTVLYRRTHTANQPVVHSRLERLRGVVRGVSTPLGIGDSASPPRPGAAGGTERVLLDAGILVPSQTEASHRVSPAFRDDWKHILRHLPAPGAVDLSPLLAGGRGGDASVDVTADAVEVTEDDDLLRWWPSTTAFRADAAAARYLADSLARWESFDLTERTAVLAAVRLWLQRCPDCGGRLAFSDEPVESVRAEAPVHALTCQGCDARLVEAPTGA